MLWFLYGLSILLVWFENRCVVLPVWDRPPIFFNQALLWIVRLLLTYGTLGGLWAIYGFKTAAIALGFFYVVNKLTFKIYFDGEVRKTAARLRKLPPSPYANLDRDKSADEATLERETLELARDAVTRNVKGQV